ALVFFFLLRVLDEHKDEDVDRRFRPELPVPRGLVTLAELRWLGGAALALVRALNAWAAPALLVPILGVGAWATLMTKEFSAPGWAATAWLAARQTGAGAVSAIVLALVAAGCAITGVDFLRAPAARRSKRIELASQVWPLFTYSLLGAGPFLFRRFGV